MNNPNNFDREAWLTEAMLYVLDDILYPLLPDDYKAPHNFRISLGLAPRTTIKSKVIACCIQASASADSTNEIFITPAIDNPISILEAMTHEAIHYLDDCQSGHKNFFAKLARKAGLLGKLTATHASPELIAKLEDIVDTLGAIPHAKIILSEAKKKQTTRMLKIACLDQNCGFAYRASAKQLAKIQEFECPACCTNQMKIIDA